MAKVRERVAYLHGLTKGLNVNDKTPEGKAIMHIIDVLEDIADDVECMHRGQQELETYVESIDEDLTDLEEDFYEDCDCDTQDFVDVACPVCHEDVSFEEDLLHEENNVEVSCPHCGSVVYDNLIEGSYVPHHHDHDPRSHYCADHHYSETR